MKKIFSLLTISAVSMLVLSGCYYDNQQDLYPKITCDVTSATYSGNVATIIQSNCISCHSSAAQLGGVNLEGYTNLKPYASNGKLAGVIEQLPGFSPMPKGASKLNECDIAVIKKWISDGAGNN
jgi:mono/diheme cytochrome c family protein